MPITNVQQGVIGQSEFAKLVMMGTGGAVEVAATLTDDDRRDAEIHVRGHYGFALANQIKTTMELHRSEGGSRYLICKFPIRPERIVNDPYFWYVVAHLDPKLMRFADPVFFVPSTEMHTHARDGWIGNKRHFKFVANMDPNSRDRWVARRVNTLDLGKKVLETIEELEKQAKHTKNLLLPLPLADPSLLWLRKAA